MAEAVNVFSGAVMMKCQILTEKVVWGVAGFLETGGQTIDGEMLRVFCVKKTTHITETMHTSKPKLLDNNGNYFDLNVSVLFT